ncbi:hypothetical protein ATANTOWER_000820 [Ataeniobius toweri]|uniref:Uncharacterized protein n=1 Tax=Ataeniobius toweri TaxID=208326 RepID=A0ABU7C7X4_9TELE|nr:hypothetical protein [Ataeniobius toweri]
MRRFQSQTERKKTVQRKLMKERRKPQSQGIQPIQLDHLDGFILGINSSAKMLEVSVNNISAQVYRSMNFNEEVQHCHPA